jgi:hypothetical protein
MASSLGLLLQKLSFALGTAETTLYTVDKRKDGINKAIEHILQMYPIPQYRLDTTLAFTSGVATLPTDFVRCWKLWNSTNSVEYVMVDPSDFDNNISYSFTIKWNAAILPSGGESVYCYPADTVTLNLRYSQTPVDMTTDSQITRFPERWDDGIVELAAYFLLTDSRNFDAAAIINKMAREHLTNAWSVEAMRFQDPRLNRLESKFESMGLLRGTYDNWHSN